MIKPKISPAYFPILNEHIGGHPLIYLDSAATSQKPKVVLEAIVAFYKEKNSNVARAAHALASQAETLVEGVREQLATFLHARCKSEVVFTAGSTASLNLVASAYGMQVVQAGDEVLVSMLEHHSNFLPWQWLCDRVGATLRVIPITSSGDIDQEAYGEMLSPRTRIVALTHLSNALGTLPPLRMMIAAAHRYQAVTVVDAAQAVQHLPIDVQKLDCDFLAFSSHKMYGPTGLGVLYGKKEYLRAMVPYQFGGGMAQYFGENRLPGDPFPHLLEAGTLHLAGIAGLGAAISFLGEIGYPAIQHHDERLMNYATQRLAEVPGLAIVGAPSKRVGILSFIMDGVHPLDIGVQLDMKGIAVRTGDHCATHLMRALGLEGSVRISLAPFNHSGEIDRLAGVLRAISQKRGV